MDSREARQILSTKGWLSLTPAPFREAVLANCELHHFPAGKTVYAQGDQSSGLWGLVEGALGVERSGKRQDPRFAFFAAPGFWIGAQTLVLRTERKVGLVAVRSSDVLHLSSNGFQRIADENPEAWRWLSVLPLLQNELAFGVLEDLLIRNSTRRCAAMLLRLAGCRGLMASETPRDIFVTQEQLAEMINLSRTALGELLRDFEGKGLIARVYGRITIDRLLLEGIAASK